MKKAILIFLLLALHWQTLAAAERAFAHALAGGNQASHALALQHFIEHSLHVPHHHDADGAAPHADSSPESLRHLLDTDQAGSFHAVLPSMVTVPVLHAAGIPSACPAHPISDGPPRPLFRPPRTRA